MRTRFAVFAALACAQVYAAPNILNDTSHASNCIAPAIVAVLGGGIVDAAVHVDYTNGDPISDATNPLATVFKVADGTPDNNAPYVTISVSYSGYTLNLEVVNYAALNAGGIVDDWAYVPNQVLPISTPPPILMTNVNTTPFNTGGGIEFGMSSNYKGLDTATPSCVTAGFSGLLVSMRYQHPTWTWGDIKGAFRQTAANWATGYNYAAYGYGNINYDAATALASTTAIFLQPPLMTIVAAGNQLQVTLYPFRSTRRAREVVYRVSTAYAWPIKNEYTAADIAASGGTLVYTSNGTDAVPSVLLNQTGTTPGLYNFMAFTTDDLGNYSRVEPFSAIPVRLYGSGVTCP